MTTKSNALSGQVIIKTSILNRSNPTPIRILNKTFGKATVKKNKNVSNKIRLLFISSLIISLNNDLQHKFSRKNKY